jgi:membrane-associated protease RseP (regulator of RpoE activity)
MQLIGILAFVVALLLSVMVHEFGHFITARKFDMKVSEFFLGFGTRIWSTQRGETEFGVKAIPAGGYCRIQGMDPDEEMEPGQEHRSFYKASSARKLVVLGAGSFNHFLLGFLLLFALLAGVGVNTLTSTVASVAPNSAAEKAGFQKGDVVVSIQGKEVTDWIKDVDVIRNSNGRELSFVVNRNGERVSLVATPVLTKISESESRYLVGLVNEVGTKRINPVTSFTSATSLTWEMTVSSAKALIALPSKLPALWGQTFGGEERDPNGLVGVVGVSRVSGEVAASGDLTWTQRIGTFILIVASLNIFVGLFNLLPILPLDGGHMAIAIADEIRAFFARLRGRPRPAGIDVKVLTPITMVVFVLLAAMTVLLLIADIFNPVSLNL